MRRRLSIAAVPVAFTIIAACHENATSTSPTVDPCVLTEAPPAVVAPRTPRWAFEPWISKDISTRDDTYAFVDGFRSRGIPIGTVVLDSPWETNYNTFVPSPTRYGDFAGMVSDMHARGVHVVLWTTMLVNSTSFDLEPGADPYPGPADTLAHGQDCGYFVDDGTTYPWWKGKGAGLDFFNPSARAWWHAQQDVVLDAGVDGWKLDFGENYVVGGQRTSVSTMDGDKTLQEYGERYYQDFLEYGRTRRGPEFLTMTRAWDESYGFPGRFFAKKEHSPISWMGDNRRDFFGLKDALTEAFISARAGYAAVGSDLGGYLDRDDLNLTGPEIPFDTLVFARWTAVGALSPLMQLHGRANIAPWTVPDHVDETVLNYKYWAQLHHGLVPFMYSVAEESYAGHGDPILRPLAAASSSTDFRYMLGDALLVAPIVDASGKGNVTLPSAEYFADFFTGTESQGGAVVPFDYSADRRHIPLFAKAGAIVPMTVDGDALGFGPYAGALTVMMWPGATATTFPLRDDHDAIITLGTSATKDELHASAKAASGSLPPTVLRLHDLRAPLSVKVNGADVPLQASESALASASSGYTYDAAAHVIVVKAAAAAAQNVVVTRGP